MWLECMAVAVIVVVVVVWLFFDGLVVVRSEGALWLLWWGGYCVVWFVQKLV